LRGYLLLAFGAGLMAAAGALQAADPAPAAPATGATKPASAALHKIYVRNVCPRPVQVLIDNAEVEHTWQPHAWFQLKANEATYLTGPDGAKLSQLADHQLYFYAETTDSAEAMRWHGDGPEVQWQNMIYRTARITPVIDKDGDFVLRLTCNG